MFLTQIYSSLQILQLILAFAMITGNALAQDLWWAPPDERYDSIVIRDKSTLGQKAPTVVIVATTDKIGALSLKVESHIPIWDTVPRPLAYYPPDCILIVADSATETIDTLTGIFANCRSSMHIVDFCDSLKWDVPLFCIESIGSSDINQKEFIEFRSGKLKSLFGVDDLIEIRRDSDSILRGTDLRRDELVHGTQEYPFSVSLSNYEVVYVKPDVQTINFESAVLEEFVGYRLIDDQRVPYVFKVGTAILVETLFRSQKLVRVVVGEGIRVMVDYDVIEGKIQTENAG